jgi:membrane protein implicated in regulation of membrane protease activity
MADGGNSRGGPGLSATWWGGAALICSVAAIGGLVKGIWWAAIFFVPAVFGAVMALRSGRIGNY